MPAAGRLDRRVTIEAVTTARDALGQPVETWTTWKTVWMGKKDIRAAERFRADQEIAEETTVWMSHWIDGLTAQHRLVVEDKTYDIVGLAEIGRRAGLEITATASRV